MVSKKVVRGLLVVLLTGLCNTARAEVIADFEDLALAPESYWKGSDNSGGFTSGIARFNNCYNQDWDSWDGFAYSNITDTTTKGWTSQYNAITGGGQGSSANYAVGYYVDWPAPKLPTMTLDEPTVVSGLYVTNTNYAYYLMLEGGGMFNNKKFSNGDWFLLEITGKDVLGNVTETIPFYLADFRDGKNTIVNDWQYVDLTALGVIKSLEFRLSSTDNDQVYGMNTPGYFAIDTVLPEPATLVLLGFGAMVMRKNTRC